MRWHIVAAAALLGLSGTAYAQAPTIVSATDPEGMAAALVEAGYDTESDVDAYGDPLLLTNFGSYKGQVVFYGCDETSHSACDSVQLTVGLDRDEPLPFGQLNEIVANQRFVAISLDEEGDPWITWDVVTLDGIPGTVFLHAVEQFSTQVQMVADKVFEDQPEA